MGAMCCKSAKFEGEGHRLDRFPRPAVTDRPPVKERKMGARAGRGTVVDKPTEQRAAPAAPAAPAEAHPTLTSDPRRAAAQAAEARARAAQIRGTKGGEIAKALSQQPADGGRVDQAIEAAAAKARNNPLVWD